jgi:hypothetical protein
MKKIIFNGQRRNKHFLIVIYHSSLVKGTMYAARLCKLRNGVKKCLNFFFFQWPKVDQVGNEYSPQLSELMAYWQVKNRRRSHTLKGSHSMGDGRIFLKTGRDASFIKDLSNEPNFDWIHLAGQYL